MHARDGLHGAVDLDADQPGGGIHPIEEHVVPVPVPSSRMRPAGFDAARVAKNALVRGSQDMAKPSAAESVMIAGSGRRASWCVIHLRVLRSWDGQVR
jgi:hypothetical protein